MRDNGVAHMLSIGTLHNHCRFVGHDSDATALSSELGRLSEQRLPELIGEALERRLSHRLTPGAIYRIRTLRLHFSILKQNIDSGQLARSLAEHLAEALEVQLDTATSDVVIFPDEAHYLARLMADLLNDCAWQSWIHQDYSALRLLEPMEAVVQLLLPRRDDLLAIVAGLVEEGTLTSLLQRLDARHAEQLFIQWAGANIVQQFQSPLLPEAEALEAMVDWLPHAAEADSDTSLALPTLRVFIQSLRRGPPPGNLRDLLWTCAHRIFLLRHGHEVATLLRAPATPANSVTQQPLSVGRAPATIAADMMRWVEGSSAGARYLDRHRAAKLATSGTVEAPFQQQATEVANNDNTMLFQSRHAALVLLIPTLLSLRLQRCYTMQTLRDALMTAILGEHSELGCEPWLMRLLPDDQGITENGELPSTWALGFPSQRVAEIEVCPAGHKQVAGLLLGHLAGRLGGLQGSSDHYLRTQFLRTGGTIDFDHHRILARLNPVALDIVLRMSGLADWQGDIPWLNIPLQIEVST